MMKDNPAFKTAIRYGLPIGISLNIIFHLLLTGDEAYLGNDNVSLLMFSLVCVTFIIMFKNHFKKYTNKVPDLSHIALLILTFGFVVAACMGLGHFINATFIDPSWSENSLALMQERWTAANYSKEAIAGQIEWTDTFHNPWKWSLVITIFFSILYSIPGLLIGMAFFIRHNIIHKHQAKKIDFQ